ncbi:hypothetical protein LR48_Vigan01g214600 [Vigna angularis]|uniref:HMA domain-containing protein n=1 Tax=Phaseolus angularis TaxID=3914 RepID=A0A0L9TPV3_PHAAN|nr:hypothetical protein LR48_Vigan01g214600 [Vigna angularis]
MAINNTESEVCMKATTNDNRSLLHMENLTLPPFQVVVIAANMGCNGCRGRVFRVVSRMTGRFQTLFCRLWRNLKFSS